MKTVCWKESRIGAWPVPTVNGRILCSAVDPWAEGTLILDRAGSLNDYNNIIALGAGSIYTVCLAAQIYPHLKFFIFDPNTEFTMKLKEISDSWKTHISFLFEVEFLNLISYGTIQAIMSEAFFIFRNIPSLICDSRLAALDRFLLARDPQVLRQSADLYPEVLTDVDTTKLCDKKDEDDRIHIKKLSECLRYKPEDFEMEQKILLLRELVR